MKKFILLLTVCLLSLFTKSQLLADESPSGNKDIKESKVFFKPTTLNKERRINFYVMTIEKSNKIDYTTISVRIRAAIRGFLDRKKLYVIVVKSSEEAARRIAGIVLQKGKMIDNIWFDSHGHYKNRFSSFRVGKDIFSFKNIRDTHATKYLKYISHYCDNNTKIALGACYAGADFYFPATDSTPATRMNGDSLMMGMGNIFKESTIYASESWVMAKPGIFANKYGFAGYPIVKKSKDIIFEPVWKRIGKWRQYKYGTGLIENISTVSMDRAGNINIKKRDFNLMDKTQKKIAIKLKKLKPGLAYNKKP